VFTTFAIAVGGAAWSFIAFLLMSQRGLLRKWVVISYGYFGSQYYLDLGLSGVRLFWFELNKLASAALYGEQGWWVGLSRAFYYFFLNVFSGTFYGLLKMVSFVKAGLNVLFKCCVMSDGHMGGYSFGKTAMEILNIGQNLFISVRGWQSAASN